MTTDQRVVAKQDIQEVESTKRAAASYAHHRYQAKDANMKLRQKIANAPRARRYRDKRPSGIGEGWRAWGCWSSTWRTSAEAHATKGSSPPPGQKAWSRSGHRIHLQARLLRLL